MKHAVTLSPSFQVSNHCGGHFFSTIAFAKLRHVSGGHSMPSCSTLFRYLKSTLIVASRSLGRSGARPTASPSSVMDIIERVDQVRQGRLNVHLGSLKLCFSKLRYNS